MSINRRDFLRMGGSVLASAGLTGLFNCSSKTKEIEVENDLFFDLSLAEWSLHRRLFNGKLDHLDFPATAKHTFGFTAVEYVNQFFPDKAKDKSYLNELNLRCSDLGVEQVRIMIDNEGDLAVNDDKKRMKAVLNHHKWVEAAKHLGCKDIRVNARGNGTPEEQKKAAVDGLGRLTEFAKDYDISIIVENHGGYSSNGKWLADVMKQVGKDNCGTLPDFGNFCLEEGENGACEKEYDRYKGVKVMMPYAKGVSAKSYAFNDDGEETTIDYKKMLKIVRDAGYTGYLGIEYEGDQRSEPEGIQATKALLLKIGAALSDQQAYLNSL